MNLFDKNNHDLYFIPLGGAEQFGVNLNAYISNGEILVVDCGMGFADEHYPGVDLLLPDPAFLEKNADRIAGLIITHAHEDHIGAVAHLWGRLSCPVYASPFTVEILRKKFEEHNLRGVPVHTVVAGDSVQIGAAFHTQFVPVAHSIPDACALIIETPQGRIVHSGDWNLDPHPVTGHPTNPLPFQEAGKKGVLAYIGDSTNAGVDGYAGSEADVQKGLEAEFKRSTGRIAVTIFSSNIGRIISIARAAEACGRNVAVIGRSLHRMIGAAKHCGYMDDVPEFVDEEQLEYIPDDKLVVIMTGSQGEYRSALARAARGDHDMMDFKKGDTVIYSSREIPGNEREINAVKNNLSAAGVNIITPRDTEHCVHVSGHPCRSEILEMLGWLKPQIVVPVHGERTQLDAHARLAKSVQIAHAIVPHNGAVIRLSGHAPDIVDHVETGLLAVEQKRIISATHQSLVGRRKLQYTGVVHVSVVLDAKGELRDEPLIHTIGLIDEENDSELEFEDHLFFEVESVVKSLRKDELKNDDVVGERIRVAIRRLVNHKLGIKPNTTVHVLRV